MIALGILLTYGLQLTVTADLAWQGLRKKISNAPAGEPGAVDDDDDGEDGERSAKMTAYYYAMRFTLILGTSKGGRPRVTRSFDIEHYRLTVLRVLQ